MSVSQLQSEENRENPKKSPCFVAEYIVTLAIAREHQNFPSCLVVVAFPVNQVKPTDSGGCQPLLAPPPPLQWRLTIYVKRRRIAGVTATAIALLPP